MSDVCFVQANGLRFGYLEAGDGPLVLLVRCEVVAVPGGHFMRREHPERFTAELLGVLARARRGRG